MSQETQEQLHVNADRHSHCRVTLTVQVPSVFSKKARKEAIKNINKEVSLPGFRKGKAPESYIEKNYAPHLEQQWKQILAEETLNQAIEQSSLYPLDRERSVKANWKNLNSEGQSTVIFEYETSPEIPEIDLSSLEVQVPPKSELTDKELEHEIEVLQKRSSRFEEIEEEAKEGTWVEILTEKESDSQAFYGGKRFECRPGAMPTELYEAVVGMKIGEEKVVDLLDPKSSSQEKVSVKVKLEKVLIEKLPEINEEFAKTLGMDSKEALIQRLRDNLERSKNYDYESNLFDSIQDALLQRYSFELPKTLFDHESRMSLEQKLHDYRQKNDGKEPSEEEKSKLQEEANEHADKAVRNTFLIYHLASQEKIQIHESEVRELMNPYLHDLQNEKDPNRLRQRFNALYSRCRMHLLTERVLHHIAKKLALI